MAETHFGFLRHICFALTVSAVPVELCLKGDARACILIIKIPKQSRNTL